MLSALGDFIGVCPEWDDSRRKWLCVAFDRQGNWRSMSVHNCKGDAIKARAKLFRHHRKLKAERQMMSSKRRKQPAARINAPAGRKETE